MALITMEQYDHQVTTRPGPRQNSSGDNFMNEVPGALQGFRLAARVALQFAAIRAGDGSARDR